MQLMWNICNLHSREKTTLQKKIKQHILCSATIQLSFSPTHLSCLILCTHEAAALSTRPCTSSHVLSCSIFANVYAGIAAHLYVNTKTSWLLHSPFLQAALSPRVPPVSAFAAFPVSWLRNATTKKS